MTKICLRIKIKRIMSLIWTNVIVDSDGLYDMDVFFQPALTWSEGTAKGIGLFFLENDPTKTDDLGNLTGQDFKILVQGMLTWIWKVGGNEMDTVCLLYTSPSPRDRG